MPAPPLRLARRKKDESRSSSALLSLGGTLQSRKLTRIKLGGICGRRLDSSRRSWRRLGIYIESDSKYRKKTRTLEQVEKRLTYPR